jgi:Tfp pilus assembly protein PilF
VRAKHWSKAGQLEATYWENVQEWDEARRRSRTAAKLSPTSARCPNPKVRPTHDRIAVSALPNPL